MIRAEFQRRGGRFVAVSVSGHAGFAEAGEDIVCASVTSAVQMTANGITEVLQIPASVTVEENRISLQLPGSAGDEAAHMLASLHLHLGLLEEEYSQHIKLTVLEV